MQNIVRETFEKHLQLAARVRDELSAEIARAADCLITCFRDGHKLLLCGNGGSAADAQHIAAELTGRYRREREGLAAIALTTDTSVITACANDMGFDTIFARQLESVGRPGDVALGISTSGRSPNVIAGLRRARDLGLVTLGMCGQDARLMGEECDVVLAVPSTRTPRVQEMHIMLGHMLCSAVEQRLGLA